MGGMLIEGMLKSPPQPETQEQPRPPSATETLEPQSSAIAPEVFDYFDVGPSVDKEKLTTIVSWAREGADSLPMSLKNLKALEHKLGTLSLGAEGRINKIYNYVKVSNSIRSRQGTLNETLKGIRENHAKRLSMLKETRDKKVAVLNQEIKNIQADFNRAQQVYDRTASEKSSQIKKEYARQIADLKVMRNVYKGGQ